jgi:antitoxin VapB
MALNIRNPEADRLATELAALSGESKTDAVIKALEDRIDRIRREKTGYSLAEELMEIGRHCASLPVYDDRTADEILGYDENGLPT